MCVKSSPWQTFTRSDFPQLNSDSLSHRLLSSSKFLSDTTTMIRDEANERQQQQTRRVARDLKAHASAKIYLS